MVDTITFDPVLQNFTTWVGWKFSKDIDPIKACKHSLVLLTPMAHEKNRNPSDLTSSMIPRDSLGASQETHEAEKLKDKVLSLMLEKLMDQMKEALIAPILKKELIKRSF